MALNPTELAKAIKKLETEIAEGVKVNLGSNWKNNYFTQNARFLFANVIDTSQLGFKALGTPDVENLSASGQYYISVDELKIWNSESSNATDSLHFKLPSPITKHVYVKCKMATDYECNIKFTDGTEDNWYRVVIYLPNSSNDFHLQKCVNGSITTLASEGVDLSARTDYLIEFLWDAENGILKVWRDGSLIFNVQDTEFNTFDYINFVYYGAGGYARYRPPIIITWE